MTEDAISPAPTGAGSIAAGDVDPRGAVPSGWRFDASGGGWEFVAFLMVALVAQVLADPRSSGIRSGGGR